MSNSRFRIDAFGNFGVGYSNLHNLAGAAGSSGAGGVYSGGGGGAGTGGFGSDYKLVAEKLKEWEWMERFIASNPDVKERWETHKTFEILRHEHRSEYDTDR